MCSATLILRYSICFFARRLRLISRDTGSPTLIRDVRNGVKTSERSLVSRVFSTAHPLSLFLEKLSLLASKCCMDLDISHIAGHDNGIADKLSRWDFESSIP